jgi:hypothetical protein
MAKVHTGKTMRSLSLFNNTGWFGFMAAGRYLADINESGSFPVVVAKRTLEGDRDLNQPDNLEFQSGTGIMYLIEDNTFGDI